MKVLMFGWEFPPFNTGGLGTACYGLTRGLNNWGVKVTFVLPRIEEEIAHNFVNVISADIKLISVNSLLKAYMTSHDYSQKHIQTNKGKHTLYGGNLQEEVRRYSKKAKEIALLYPHDVIHTHDWMTYLAGIEAKKASGKPLVIHVHATEFDRSGSNVNQEVYDIERRGMEEADAIISVSNLTKKIIINNYGINPEKIYVVHNAVDFNDNKFCRKDFKIKNTDKIVLFLGRITMQKGPDYFVYAAKKVLGINPNIKFIVVGNGDMERFIIEKTAELGIADKFMFAGFLRGADIDKAYQMADLYVMPSVSEPFGITPLEAMRNKTPVIISKQSGVSEVINHCLKVDFWDIDELANKILAVLKYQELHESLVEHGAIEIKKFNWDKPAEKCIEVYTKVAGDIVG